MMENETKFWVIFLLAILGILFASPLLQRSRISRTVFKFLSVLMWILLVILELSMPVRTRW